MPSNRPCAAPDGPRRAPRSIPDVPHRAAEGTVEFMYQDFQPNGPQCGPSCRGASVSVTVGSIIVDAGSSEDSGSEDGLMGDE